MKLVNEVKNNINYQNKYTDIIFILQKGHITYNFLYEV